MNQIAIREPGQRSVLMDMSDRYGMEPHALEATLRATVVPNNCTKEQFTAFLMIAKEYKLNPILKEIYAFQAKGGGIQPIVGVDGWANLINQHTAFDGMDFEDHVNDSGELVSITCRMYRKDRSHATTATEYLAECKRSTEPWTKWPRRMLRHKAMIQAARYAFSFAGIIDPDEAERFAGDFAQDVTHASKIVPISQRISSTHEGGAGHGEQQNGQTGKLLDATTAGAQTGQAGEMPATDSASVASPVPQDAPEAPAAEPQPPTPAAAGEVSESSDGAAPAADDGGAGDDGSGHAGPALPEGWAIAYSAILRRAQKKESLAKYATQFWAQYGGWDAHKSGPNAETAKAIFDAYQQNFGRPELINEALRELI